MNFQIVSQPQQALEATDDGVPNTSRKPWAGSPDVAAGWGPSDVSAQCLVLPAEQVALHRVTLPIRSSRQRRAALPFALEDDLGSSLDDVHIAVLDLHRDGTVLAGVVAKTVLVEAIAERPDVPVVPEQMLLRAPDVTETAQHWTTLTTGDRVLVRCGDGTGFACHVDALETLWRCAGTPPVTNHGAQLPKAISALPATDVPDPAAAALSRFDLRQGAFRPALGLERPLKWLAAALVLGLVGHLGLAVAEMRAQAEVAERFRQDAVAALETRLPGASVEQAPALLQRRILAQATPQTGSGFLPLLNRVAETWVQDGASVQLRELTWADGALRLVVDAPDLEALQQAEARLAAAGLGVSSGSATADAGSARADITVTP